MAFQKRACVFLAMSLALGLLAACAPDPTDKPDGSSKPEPGKETSAASAVNWKPTKAITIRVPFKAGGSADTTARITAQGLEQAYGQSVIVNNLTGANGALAANDLKNLPPSPNEMMVAGISLFTLSPLFNPDIQVSLDDFEVVGSLIAEDFVLLSSAKNADFNSFEGLLEYGKKNRVVFGSNPTGGTTHMLGTALFSEAKIENASLSDDGGTQNALSVVSGDATCCIVSANAAKQFVEDGSLIPLACFSEKPYMGYKGFTVESVKSKGYDIVFRSCNFLITKKGVEPETIKQIYGAILKWRESDEFKKLAANANYEPDLADGAQVRQTLEAAIALCKTLYDKYYAAKP